MRILKTVEELNALGIPIGEGGLRSFQRIFEWLQGHVEYSWAQRAGLIMALPNWARLPEGDVYWGHLYSYFRKRSENIRFDADEQAAWITFRQKFHDHFTKMEIPTPKDSQWDTEDDE